MAFLAWGLWPWASQGQDVPHVLAHITYNMTRDQTGQTMADKSQVLLLPGWVILYKRHRLPA